jgi:tetraprenyl-beta-curcumene synthase
MATLTQHERLEHGDRADAPRSPGAGTRGDPRPVAVETAPLGSADHSAFGGRRLIARAYGSLALMNARYWSTVAPGVRRQLRRWERHAQGIPDPILQAHALAKLRDEAFNAEAAATLATLAPRPHRARVGEAIVALEVMYDYLDVLTEAPSEDPLRDGRRLFTAFTGALAPPPQAGGDHYRHHPHSADGGYLQALGAAAEGALAGLPAAGAVAPAMLRAGARGAEAQVRTHAAAQLGTAQLQAWARREAQGTALQWRELLAGAACSVLCVHALIAAAADPRTTPAHAATLDTVYLSIGAVATLLDALVDYEHDLRAGELGHIRHHPDPELLAQRLVEVVHHAVRSARGLPHGAHHVMTLAGVVAYYSSAPGAASEPARAVAAQLRRELEPLSAPTFAVLRTWRLTKRLRARATGGSRRLRN